MGAVSRGRFFRKLFLRYGVHRIEDGNHPGARGDPVWRKGPGMHHEWLHWYYLIYLVPAGTAVLVLLTSGLGGHHSGLARGGHGGPHLHLSHGAAHPSVGPAHPAAHTPATTTAHAHAPVGPHAPTRGHGNHGARPVATAPGGARQLLGFFGIGRAPLPLVIGSLLIGWGFFGLAATEALRPLLRLPALFALPSRNGCRRYRVIADRQAIR